MKKRPFVRFNILALACLLALSTPLSLAQNSKKNGKTKESPTTRLSEEQKAIHLLDRISFGPRPGDVEAVKKLGWEKYLDAQLHPERLTDQAVEEKLKAIESIYLSNAELARYYPPPQVLREALKSKGLDMPEFAGGANTPQGQSQQPQQEQIAKRREVQKALKEMGYKQPQQVALELQQAKILRAVYSEKQLQEVMTDFWFNHFNVYLQKGADRVLTTSYERDVIRPHAFGKFEDLLKATAESPAMLFYLDNWQSAAPNAQMLARREQVMKRLEQRQRRNRANDEQMQSELNNNGKLKKAPRGLNENYAREIMELHTLGVDGGYTQKDVQEVARCFTGWTLRNPRAGAEFIFNPNIHDDGEKTVLGKKIPAGGGQKDGYAVIHMLAAHPSTAKFISTKLARKFVNDHPSQALIDRMAQTFQKTGGDIREVLRTMFTAPEFFASENYRAKIKTPFEMTVSAVRAVGAETNGGPQFHRWIAQMGEALFMAQPPTGYADVAENWVNAGALLQRMNFALALAGNRIPGTRVSLNSLVADANTLQTSQLVDQYAKLLLRGELSPQSRATIDKSLAEQTLAMNKQAAGSDAAKVVGLILGSPEFQRQ
ncbi:MAG TPA: DUF1800 domain-containing protein [Blastocatellia bacterium]|nr:DUF1800 domain-containing protein [Blastocatellia bacterium]HMV87263.1 DUF1800 domain-containing protein [Blastocatellia bacterium]HMX27928.1 DUF1800 domain-containing protein [Blastocatellia bacterium]HMZ21562.1 DUF1800 domain-containing protein [Blastocatellia bacterium]HNG29243.1 DUF1800 domain-containing protein [Blastocatellia bacterium]